MENQKFLIKLIVVLALLGYLASSIYMFAQSFTILVDGILPEDYLKKLNPGLMYITNGLTGLVGGIVAVAFGIEKLDNGNVDAIKPNNKLQRLESFIITPHTENNNNKGRNTYGTLYSLAYITIGVASVIIWIILEENTIQNVSYMATTFMGMLIPIVAAYFNPN